MKDLPIHIEGTGILKTDGKREYIFTTGGGTACCQQPKIVRTACQSF